MTNHGVDVQVTHLLDQFGRRSLSRFLVRLSFRNDDLVGELPHELLQSAMSVVVVYSSEE